VVPGVLLVFVPKCPLCVMAYAGMFMGLGMSFAMASYVRVGMIVVCVGAVVYLVGRKIAGNSRFKVQDSKLKAVRAGSGKD